MSKKGYVKASDVIQKSGLSCEDRLQRIVELGEDIRTIYDCGAFNGRWAQEINSAIPNLRMALIEPNPLLHEEIGQRTESFKERVQLIPVAVGDTEKTAELNIWKNTRHTNPTTALAGSSLLSHVQGKPSESYSVPVKTIDQISSEIGWTPDLIKLDLQGYEKEALLGAQSVLNNTKVVISEFGCLQAYENRTKPKELFDILDPYGFLLYDIVDLRYRPYDNAWAGGDFIFVKHDSVLLAHKDYF